MNLKKKPIKPFSEEGGLKRGGGGDFGSKAIPKEV